MSFSETLLPEYDQEMASTRKILLRKACHRPDFRPFNAIAKAEILDFFNKSVVAGRAALAAASDEDLSKIWELEYGGRVVISMPRTACPGIYGPSADDKLKQL